MGDWPKCLLERDGMPLIERTVRLLLDAGTRPVVVVLGHHAAQIEPVLRRVRETGRDPDALRWVVNPNPDVGPGGSLRAGLAALPHEVPAVLVALADQPLLCDGDVDDLLRAWRARGADVALLVPRFGGQPGHPLVFDARVGEAVRAQPPAQGLRDWRLQHPQQVAWLDVAHPRHTTDADTLDDLARLAREHHVRLRRRLPEADSHPDGMGRFLR